MAVNKVVLKSGKVLMDTSGVTVEPGTLYKGKTALNREGKLIEGTLEPGVANEVEQAVPQITVSAGGLVVASAMQEGGYVAEGTARSEMQLPVQAGKIVMPSTTDQVAVGTGKYTTGAVTVKGDANLKAENIAEGVSIFGIVGAHKGGAAEEGASVGNVFLTVEAEAEGNAISEICFCMLENGSVTTVVEYPESKSMPYYVLSGSFLAIRLMYNAIGSVSGEGAEVIGSFTGAENYIWFFAKVTAAPGETAQIRL